LELLWTGLVFILLIRFEQTLENVALRYHEAVEGFFGASQGRADNTSFEGANKSGATAQWPLDFGDARARTVSRCQHFGPGRSRWRL